MVNNTEKKPLDIVDGTIERVYAPKESANGRWVPGKVYVNTAEGDVAITFWPAGDWDEATRVKVTRVPIEMSAAWHQIQGREGARILLIAERGDDYEGRRQYSNATIKSIEGASPEPAATPAEPSPRAPEQAPVPYAPASRTEQGMALGNAKGVGGNIIAAYVQAMGGDLPGDEWLVAAANAVNVFSMALLTPAPEPEVEPEVEPEQDFIASLGTLSEEN